VTAREFQKRKEKKEGTDCDKEVGLRRVEQDELDRAFDLFEWSLGMSPRHLMDPYSALPPSTGFGDHQQEYMGGVKGMTHRRWQNNHPCGAMRYV
jgi:hypothetical protein